MDTLQPAKNAPITPAHEPKRRRISPRVRLAISLRVEQGLTGDKAAKAAGLSPAGFWKAWKMPHVQELYEDLKLAYILNAEAKRGLLKARALEVAEDLLLNSASDQVKARMVEFLAGEPKSGPSVAVQVNVDRGGYEYARPGAQVVEIRQPATDPASDDGDS